MPKLTKPLTQIHLDNLPVPKRGQVEHFDTAPKGFCIRVAASGVKTYVVRYRMNGRLRRYKIASVADMKLKKAREAAQKIKTQVAEGIDPLDERAAKRAEVMRKADTVEAVAAEFIEKHAKRKNRTWRQTERLLAREVLPLWGKRDMASITRRDALDLLDRVIERGVPVRANRILAGIKKMWNWAVERDIIENSPISAIKPPSKENRRDRVLSDDEIRDVWEGCDYLGYPFGPFIKVLLLTGQRRDEVARMKRGGLNQDAVWTLPAQDTKSNRPHTVPLSPMAMDLLKALPQTGEHFFTSGRVGDSPISGFSNVKAQLDKISGVTDWRLHDLRRTAASGMAKLRIAPHVIEKVLNHASGTFAGVAGVYNVHGYDDEKRHALEAWANKVDAILHPDDTGKVVRLHGQ